MTNSEILKLVIDKAKLNGWNKIEQKGYIPVLREHYPMDIYLAIESNAYKIIIFDIDFAKAFWGTNTNDAGYAKESNYQKIERVEEWEHHLQQMVLEPEPLKYLEKFL